MAHVVYVLVYPNEEGDLDVRPNVVFTNHNVIEKFSTEQKIDFIIHAAGIASPYYYRAYPLETLEVAINGTKNMLELAEQKSARLTFFSSSEIYGDPQIHPHTISVSAKV